MNTRFWTTLLAVLPACACLALPAHANDDAANDGPEVSITPGGQYVDVRGDEHKFRTDHWITDGWAGGLEEATLHQALGEDATLDFEARAVFDEADYRLRLELVKPEVGFIRAGATVFRKYFDDTGGYYRSFSMPAFSLDRELHLDTGSFFVEAGLTLPDLPQIVVGYERQFKDGEKSLLEWGAATEGVETRRIVPAVKDIDETVDIIKVSIDHQFENIRIGDQFRYERYDSDARRRDTAVDLNAATAKTVTVREHYEHDAFFNTFHLSSHVNEKTFWSLGYLFNTLDGEAGLRVMTPPPLNPFDRNWMTRTVDVDLDSHVVNLNLMVGPFGGLSAYAGLQGERTETEGFTDALLTDGLGPTTANLIYSSNDKDSLEETLGLRYTAIPYTTLYAEGAWAQQQIDLRERETEDGLPGFTRSTEACVNRQRYSVGFNTAPLRRVSLSGRYRHSIYDNDYDNEVDTTMGYPAFITGQEFTTDELMAKLTLRPCAGFNLSVKYQLVATDVRTGTESIALLAPGGEGQSANYDSSIYTVSATVTPISRLYLTGLVSFQDTRTTAADNDSTAVLTYDGNVYTILGAAGYALCDAADLTVEYTYSRSDNFTDNSADGLPLGLDNSRHAVLAGLRWRLSDNVQARLRYGFYSYNETSNGGIDDYTAHLAAASCTLRF